MMAPILLPTMLKRSTSSRSNISISSIMSQKKNPSTSVLINAGIAARHMSLVDEGNRLEPGGGASHFMEAVRYVMNGLGYAKGILETMTWDTKRMREMCNYGFMCNPDLCRVIVQDKGLPWRTAHQITAIMTRKAQEKGWEMADVTSKFLDECAKEWLPYGKSLGLSEETIREAFNPENSLRSLKSPGSAAPGRVKEQIANSVKRLKQDRATAKVKRDKLKTAADKLEKTIDVIIEKEM